MRNICFLLLLLICTSCKSQTSDSINNNDYKIIPKKMDKAVLAAGSLFRIDTFPSNYITSRPVDIWLPENYSESKKYAVLYMHDGQNLFDSTTTWNRQEWKVDEWATQLIKQGEVKDFIVVGIHNIPNIRWQDLFPEKAMDYMNASVRDAVYEEASKNGFSVNLKGDDYLKFLVQELKPFIDNTYATHQNRENTFVAGSSMGGLMSMYAVSEYPEIFSGAACLSTHWVGVMPKDDNPFPKAIFKYLEANIPSPNTHKFYFDYGNKTLDQHYPQYATRVDSIFKNAGYNTSNFRNLFFEGTDHSENSWNKRLDNPLTFLLGY